MAELRWEAETREKRYRTITFAAMAKDENSDWPKLQQDQATTS